MIAFIFAVVVGLGASVAMSDVSPQGMAGNKCVACVFRVGQAPDKWSLIEFEGAKTSAMIVGINDTYKQPKKSLLVRSKPEIVFWDDLTVKGSKFFCDIFIRKNCSTKLWGSLSLLIIQGIYDLGEL